MIRVIVLVVGLAVVGLATLLYASRSSDDGSGSLIAFHSDRDGGDYDIYVMRPDGKAQVRLSDFAGPDREPAWSPDGSRIAFWSRCGAPDPCWTNATAPMRPYGIVVMNADGSGKTQLERATEFSWSPDGEKLALTVGVGTAMGPSAGIHIIEVGKPGLTRLTTTRGDRQPAWSPDGRRIAYVSPVRVPPPAGYPDAPALIDSGEIFVMNADGSEPRRLVGVEQGTTPSGAPLRWSPDGTRLLYYTLRQTCELLEEVVQPGQKPGCTVPSGVSETYVIDVVSRAATRISSDTGIEPWPVWSPDGKRIAFTSSRDGNDEIYVMNADGSNVKRLTNQPAGDQWPTWSPDGKRLAFQSYRDGNWEIYVMNADGSKQTNVSKNTAADWEPAWSPARRK